MNIDAGTMSPTEHGRAYFPFTSLLLPCSSFSCCTGEVFVLDDGGEADLDLGNYERYLNVTLGRDNNITTGKIYREVIEKEVRDAVLSGGGETLTLCAICRGAETTLERPFRSFLTSRTRFRIGLRGLLRSRWTSRDRLRKSASSRYAPFLSFSSQLRSSSFFIARWNRRRHRVRSLR